MGTTVGYNDNMVTVGASFKVGERGNVKKVYPGEAAKEQKEINEKQQQIIAKLAAKVGV